MKKTTWLFASLSLVLLFSAVTILRASHGTAPHALMIVAAVVSLLAVIVSAVACFFSEAGFIDGTFLAGIRSDR